MTNFECKYAFGDIVHFRLVGNYIGAVVRGIQFWPDTEPKYLTWEPGGDCYDIFESDILEARRGTP